MEILNEWLGAVGERKKLKLFVQGYPVSNPASSQTLTVFGCTSSSPKRVSVMVKRGKNVRPFKSPKRASVMVKRGKIVRP